MQIRGTRNIGPGVWGINQPVLQIQKRYRRQCREYGRRVMDQSRSRDCPPDLSLREWRVQRETLLRADQRNGQFTMLFSYHKTRSFLVNYEIYLRSNRSLNFSTSSFPVL